MVKSLDTIVPDLIYAAGYLDGEGCFEIIGLPHKASIRVKLMNSYRPTVEWLYQTFKGTFTDIGIMSKKPMYGWYISGDECYNFLQQVLPFLKEKKPQAECIIKFRDIGIFSRYDKPNLEQIQKRGELMAEIKRLKYVHY